MPISRPSAPDARALGALILVALTCPGFSQAPALPPPPVGGPAAAGGNAAVERLRGAIAGAKPNQAHPSPATLPSAGFDKERRRAFEAFRSRKANPAMERRARSAVATGQATLVREREAAADKLGQALGLTPPDIKDLTRATPVTIPATYAPLLFVSSSMPIATLRTYAAQLERTGGAMAFRGLPGGLKRVGPMARLSADILRIDPGCEGPACAMRAVEIVVDPIAFRQHGIARVPALVMVPGDPTQPYCERDENAPVPATPVVYGDAALSGLLEEYARLGGAREVRDAAARLGAR